MKVNFKYSGGLVGRVMMLSFVIVYITQHFSPAYAFCTIMGVSIISGCSVTIRKQ